MDHRRRVAFRSWVVVAALVAAGWFAGCGSVDDAEDVLRDAGASAPAETWGFVDRSDAEQLLECVAGVESVRVVVDRVASRVSIGDVDGDAWVALWTPQWSYVAPSALGLDGGEWVRVDRDDSVAVRTIEDALGLSMAAYVFAVDLPPSPSALVESALEFAAEVEFVEPAVGAARDVRVVVDEARIAEVADASVTGFPSLTFTIDGDDDLVSVAARGGGGGEESFGFRWEFDSAPPPAGEVPARWRALDDVEVRPVDRSVPSCRIGP
jgi:hypothetical protein